MPKYQSLSEFTSQDFEQEILNRFRNLVEILPEQCQVYRETWNNDTVICLNFKYCPYDLEYIKENSPLIVDIVIRLSLAKSIIFREENQLKAWRNCV